MSDLEELLHYAPDLPRWVEIRSMLLSGHYRILGRDDGGVVVRHSEFGMLAALRSPGEALVREAVSGFAGGYELICVPAQKEMVAAALPDWKGRDAIFFELEGKDPDLTSAPEEMQFRLLMPDEEFLFSSLNEGWKKAMRFSIHNSFAAAGILDRKPMAFCSAPAQTETMWNVAIVTRETKRRRGYASAAVAYLIRHMRTFQKRPIWAATEENEPSLKLAHKLGFREVDRMSFFLSPGREPGS